MNAWRFLFFLTALALAAGLMAGCSSDDSTKPPAPNRPPVANAGLTKQAEINNQVFLDGNGSHDPDGGTLSYLWTQRSGTTVVLSDSSSVAPTFMAPANIGPLVFRLAVTNPKGLTDADETLVMVKASSGNDPPTANAGVDQTVATGATVTLNGSGSSPYGGPVTFEWRQTQGPDVMLSNDAIAKPTFTAPGNSANLTFELTVKDEDGREGKDLADVTVVDSPPPTVPTLFVLNPSGSMSGFQNPHLKDGEKAPEQYIFGAAAELMTAQSLVVDGLRNLLVSTRDPQISVFAPGNQNGEVSPSRAVNGAETLLQFPASMAIGKQKDILFVGDIGHNSIGVWDGVSKAGFDGPVAPARAFWVEGLPMQPAYCAYDEGRDILYVYDLYTRSFMVFDGASTRNGKTVWSRSFSGRNATDDITGICLDEGGDRLYATNARQDAIFAWDGASAAKGTVEPARTIVIGGDPYGIAIDSGDRAYVGDGSLKSIRSFDGISALNGNATPDRTIQGEGTQLGATKRLVILE